METVPYLVLARLLGVLILSCVDLVLEVVFGSLLPFAAEEFQGA